MANEQKFEIWKSTNNDNWYWRFKAGNGEIVAGGEGYTTKQNCIHAIELVQGSSEAEIYNLTPDK